MMDESPGGAGRHKSGATDEVELHALCGVNFEVEERSSIACVDHSGSGKTMLLNLCVSREHLGFVSQSVNLIPILMAFANMEYLLAMVKNQPASARRARVLELLAAVGMADQRQKWVVW